MNFPVFAGKPRKLAVRLRGKISGLELFKKMNGPVTFTAGNSSLAAAASAIQDAVVVQHEPQSSASQAFTVAAAKLRSLSIVPIILVSIIGGTKAKVVAYDNSDFGRSYSVSSAMQLVPSDASQPSTEWNVLGLDGSTILRTLGEAPTDTSFEGKLSARLIAPWTGSIAGLMGQIEAAATPLASIVTLVIDKHAGTALMVPHGDEAGANAFLASMETSIGAAHKVCTMEIVKATTSSAGATALG